jgi:hypothetical protein
MLMRKELINLRRDARRRFLDVARRCDSEELKDDRTFALVLQMATATCGINQGDLTRVLEAHQSVVSRWMSGKTVPIPLAREEIVNRVIEEIRRLDWMDERLNRLEAT